MTHSSKLERGRGNTPVAAPCWVVFSAAFVAAACGSLHSSNDEGRSAITTADAPGSSGDGSASPGVAFDVGPGSESADPASPGLAPPAPDPGPASTPEPLVEPGTLTAGAWDDNRNLEHFLDYRASLFDTQMQGLLDFEEEDHRAAADAAASALIPRLTLDVALVIDTTGSMSDELTYLQSEFDALSSAIEAKYPEAEQRWALVVYRDAGDVYETHSVDFQVTALGFRESLGAQSSAGGGDYPEASHAALAAMNQLGWRGAEATAKLAFWVADAPHHVERAAQLTDAISTAQAQGIHLYPVASSGVDELTELSMRSAAQLTLGRYLFLTDDSGVGGQHKEPTIPCYFVTRLDDAILRMVDIEMTGTYREPAPSDVLRRGGSPAGGACLLQSGQTVFAF